MFQTDIQNLFTIEKISIHFRAGVVCLAESSRIFLLAEAQFQLSLSAQKRNTQTKAKSGLDEKKVLVNGLPNPRM